MSKFIEFCSLKGSNGCASTMCLAMTKAFFLETVERSLKLFMIIASVEFTCSRWF